MQTEQTLDNRRRHRAHASEAHVCGVSAERMQLYALRFIIAAALESTRFRWHSGVLT